MKRAYLLYTGFGKTKLVLDKIMRAPVKPKTLLISTKAIVEGSWSSEIDKWYPGQLSYSYITGSVPIKKRMQILEGEQPDMLGLNPESLDWYIKNSTSIDKITYTRQGKKVHYNTKELIDRFDLLVIDEVTLFKSSRSNRFKLIKKWAHKINNVIVLSATPTPKNIEDIWSIIYILDGGERLGKSITAFRNEYAIAIPMSNGKNRYQYPKQSVDTILDLIKDIAKSVPKPDTPLFPEPIIKKIIIKPDPQTESILKEFKKNAIVSLPDGQRLVTMSKVGLITKINQIANGSVYLRHAEVDLNDLKFRAIQHLISNVTKPVAIVYTYKFNKEQLLTLPGAQIITSKNKEDWNNNKIPIGLINPNSIAHGLNLQYSDCDLIIWYAPIWDTEKWIQTNARFCRRGQTRTVTINILMLKESFDEYIFNLCQEKFNIQYNMLERLE